MKVKKTLTIKQQLANELRKLKPHPMQDKIRVSDVHFIPDSVENKRRELEDVKKHIKTKFEEAVSFYICHNRMTRQQAEERAFEHALSRIESWNLAF